MNNNAMLTDKLLSEEFSFSNYKLRAAYALNLCTVSVSQIIDYDDVVILEQEYDAILNNLNIEQMPKDEALLKILKQLLDTITFFRIQEGDKEFIDRDYQNKMKNAIWSAIPNFGLIVSGGNPVSMAISLASQIGIGYMNYRKAKAENEYAYEKEKWQLHRAAIEQFNGLRRELFDTAWRLVDAHQIPDVYRLTERQVSQYNNILMDPDSYRRYERLDTIQNNFIAYPPFWYNFGHTANELTRLTESEAAGFYAEKAKQYYEIFIRSSAASNLLRENPIASACALEYIDLLANDSTKNKSKIDELLTFAIRMSGNANDILQLCAFAYLRIGETGKAAVLFRRLVNEKYNAVVNSQLLSTYYVNRMLQGDSTAKHGYEYLKQRIDEDYLFPMPETLLLPGKHNDKGFTELQGRFLNNQNSILIKKYGLVLDLFQEKYRILFNKCIPVPSEKEFTDHYYDNSNEAYAARKAEGSVLKNKKNIIRYIETLIDYDFPYNYLEVLNDMLNTVTALNCVQGREKMLLGSLSESIIKNRQLLLNLREKIDDGSKFTIEDYNTLIDISFEDFTGGFFELLIQYAGEYISHRSSIVALNEAETNLRDFCIQQSFETPDVIYEMQNDITEAPVIKRAYLGIELIDEGVHSIVIDDRFEEVNKVITKEKNRICTDDTAIRLIQSDTEEFDRYFIRLIIPDKRAIRRKTVAILDDATNSDDDLLFTTEGIMQIVKGKLKKTVAYDDVEVTADMSAIIVQRTYTNPHINMKAMIEMIEKLRTKPFAEIKEKRNPLEMIAGIIRK